MLPWSTFWEQNYFAALWPGVGRFLTNNFVRGGVSGLGLVNLCAGFIDLSVVFGARDRIERDQGYGDRAAPGPDDADIGQRR